MPGTPTTCITNLRHKLSHVYSGLCYEGWRHSILRQHMLSSCQLTQSYACPTFLTRQHLTGSRRGWRNNFYLSQGEDFACRDKDVPGFAEMLRFSVCDLWPLIKGRTLWIMGDSHSYDLFHAVGCLVLPVRCPATVVGPVLHSLSSSSIWLRVSSHQHMPRELQLRCPSPHAPLILLLLRICKTLALTACASRCAAVGL